MLGVGLSSERRPSRAQLEYSFTLTTPVSVGDPNAKVPEQAGKCPLCASKNFGQWFVGMNSGDLSSHVNPSYWFNALR